MSCAQCHTVRAIANLHSFTSFGFTWPPLLTKMFNVASMSSFNEQFLAPECSIGSWGFQLK